MGSKQRLLAGELGEVVLEHAAKAVRFVDLFTGSGAVSHFVATRVPIPVVSVDLQSFAVVLAASITARTSPLDGSSVWDEWYEAANVWMKKNSVQIDAFDAASVFCDNETHREVVLNARALCERVVQMELVRAYGGHYLSPAQAVWLQALRETVPQESKVQTVCLAALVRATQQCVSAPGHTAQPFQPTLTALPYIVEHWSRNLVQRVRSALISLSGEFALSRGHALQADANQYVGQLQRGDLVFVDPPYSAVQYSRFYHVLEAIVAGRTGPVSGVGRYPARSLRPVSQYSLRSKAEETVRQLLDALRGVNADVIMTFPQGEASNGISGIELTRMAEGAFDNVSAKVMNGSFSTLGGNKLHRPARVPSYELVLMLTSD